MNTIEGFRQLEPVWDALLSKSAANDVFLTWEWSFAWLQNYCCPEDLWLLTAWDEQTLVGIAPLVLVMHRKLGLNFRVLINLGADRLDKGGFIIDPNRPEVFGLLMGYLLQHKREWDLLEVNEIRACDPQFALLSGWVSSAPYDLQSCPSTHLVVPLQDDWETYFSGLSRNFRNSMRKQTRELREGGLKFVAYCGSEIKHEQMQAMLALTQRARYTELYEAQAERDFLHSMIDVMRVRGWLYLGFLYAGQEPLAYQCGFLYEGRFEDWRHGFDQCKSCNAPGKILMAEMIRDCYERGVREVDFLRGAESYKYHWNVEERSYLRYRVLSRRFLVRLVYRWLPALKTALQNLQSRWRSKEPQAEPAD